MGGTLIHLSGLDWTAVVLYLLASLILGLWFSRRGSRNVSEYFVAGRKLSWWLAGTSLVATSFAADTPLAIARIVRSQGFQGNWYWWSGAIGFVFCMFFFAPLWRRAGIMTDAELITLRYGEGKAKTLRTLLATYRGFLVNGITMGWVILGMQKIAVETLGWPKSLAIPILVAIALIYTASAGLWGVVATDFFQFGFAMFGSIALMIAVLVGLGGPQSLAEKALETATSLDSIDAPNELLEMFPRLDSGSLALFTFAFFITLQWWGGAEGGGFLAQRLFATKNERHSVLALLWFTVAHFGLRTWPWIVVGIGSLVVFPELVDPEAAYPRMMVAFLPDGLLGLMVASLLAAFMSTVSTHLNWGASYIVNDLISPRLGEHTLSDHQLVTLSRIAVGGMAIVAGAFAWQMDSIFGAWLYISEIGAGAVLIGILRWYWWRLNTWSEISALVASLILSNALRLLASSEAFPLLEGTAGYPIRFSIVLLGSSVLALLVTFCTKPTPPDVLEGFYRRVRPGGWWKPVAESLGHDCRADGPKRVDVIGWLCGIATVYSWLFGLGWLLFGSYLLGLFSLSLSAITGILLFRALSRKRWRPPTDLAHAPSETHT